MKRIMILLGFFGAPALSRANYEASKTDLNPQFKVTPERAGETYALDPVYLQRSLHDQSEILSTAEHRLLTQVCIDLLYQKHGDDK